MCWPLLDEDRSLGDIAVLYRSHWHSLEIQLEFQRRNIPFHIRGGLRFFEQAHMKDILCYLRIMQNPTDELPGCVAQDAASRRQRPVTSPLAAYQ